MRRVGLGLLLLCLGLGGALTASTLAGNLPLGASTTTTTDTTGTTATDTSATSTTATTATTTTTPAATTATTTPSRPKKPPAKPRKPAPKPVPKPAPKPAPKPVLLPARVTVGGVHVGGLTPKAASAAVRTAFRSPLVLTVEARRFRVSPARLGAVAYVKPAVKKALRARPGASVPLVVAVDGRPARAFVRVVAARVARRPVDARLLFRGLKPVVTQSRSGLRLDRVRSVARIVRALEANRRRALALPVKAIRPAVSSERLGPVVVVRRDSKRLFLYHGERFVRKFVVATGQSSYPTPVGRFAIVAKWRNPWWYPPSSSWARGLRPVPPGPGNPLGTRWMGISSPAVGIHGTPDEASLGYSRSHGCIRMRIPEAEWLFEHVRVGTPVFIVAA